MMAIRTILTNLGNSSECNSFISLKSYNQDTDGVIDIQKILNENGKNSNYFISGPPIMIKSFKKTLITNGIPSQNVLIVNWE